MPMNTYVRRRGSHFISSPSDSSIAINRFDRTSPRAYSNPTSPSILKITSEKNLPVPKGNTKVLVVDSSGEKHTTLVETNEAHKFDVLKVMSKEDGGLKREKFCRSSTTYEKSSKERLEDILKKKAMRNGKKNRPLGTKSRKIVNVSKKSSTAFPSSSNHPSTHNTYTQTEDLDTLKSNEDRSLIGLRRSSSRILYHDDKENNHLNQETRSLPTKHNVNAAAGDGSKHHKTAGCIINSTQKVIGREQHIPRDAMKDLFNQQAASNIQPEIITARHLAKYRTAQRFSTMEPSRSKQLNGSGVIFREFKKVNRNGNLRRGLSIVLFIVILSWFLQAVFRISPSDIFRIVINYLYSLPVFVKRRRRELTKVEIAVKYIGSFFKLLGSIFRN